MRTEGLGHLNSFKNPTAKRTRTQCLNQLRHRSPLESKTLCLQCTVNCFSSPFSSPSLSSPPSTPQSLRPRRTWRVPSKCTSLHHTAQSATPPTPMLPMPLTQLPTACTTAESHVVLQPLRHPDDDTARPIVELTDYLTVVRFFNN